MTLHEAFSAVPELAVKQRPRLSGQACYYRTRIMILAY